MPRKKAPLTERVCELEGCDELFTPKNKRQRFHSDKCRWKAKNEPALDAGGEDDVEPLEGETLEETLVRVNARDVERQNAVEAKKIIARAVRQRRYEEILEESIAAFEPTPLVLEPHRHGTDGSPIEWTVVLSDWHVGQKTRLEETGGIYYQDIATARKQVAKVWRALALLHELETKTYNITKLHILALGDFIENDDMRPSQHRQVEDVFTAQTVQAFDLLIWFIRQALTIFPDVEVDFIGGNHDRTGRNRGDAGLGELDYIDTVAWLLGAFTERVLDADVQSGRLKITNWTTFFGYKKIAGQKVVFEHGSSMKWGGGYGGVPWYAVQQSAPRYADMLGGADLVVFGHGHKAAIIPSGRAWVVSNGALPGTSTYVQSNWKSISRPVQWLMMLHEELGVIGWKPLYADIPEQLAAGVVWDDVAHFTGLASGKMSSPVDPEA